MPVKEWAWLRLHPVRVRGGEIDRSIGQASELSEPVLDPDPMAESESEKGWGETGPQMVKVGKQVRFGRQWVRCRKWDVVVDGKCWRMWGRKWKMGQGGSKSQGYRLITCPLEGDREMLRC